MIDRSYGAARPGREPGRAWFAKARCAALVIAIASCGEDPPIGDDRPSVPRCGDGICDAEYCETPARCPHDCGTCSGAGCPPAPTQEPGSCGATCSDSCGCQQPNEVCTADLGAEQGTCMPISCGLCEEGLICDYAADETGHCVGGVCEPG